jgi:hypothetical protein
MKLSVCPILPLTGGVLAPQRPPLPHRCAAQACDWLPSRLRFTVPASAPLTGLGSPLLVPLNHSLLDDPQNRLLLLRAP